MAVARTIFDDGKRVKLVVSGRFDETVYDAFKSAFQASSSTCKSYEVDLSRVTQMMSAGLGVLMLLRQSASAIDARVKVINPSTPAKRNLEMAFFHEMLDVAFE